MISLFLIHFFLIHVIVKVFIRNKSKHINVTRGDKISSFNFTESGLPCKKHQTTFFLHISTPLNRLVHHT